MDLKLTKEILRKLQGKIFFHYALFLVMPNKFSHWFNTFWLLLAYDFPEVSGKNQSIHCRSSLEFMIYTNIDGYLH